MPNGFKPWTQPPTEPPPPPPPPEPPKAYTDKELEELRARGYGPEMIKMAQAGQWTPPSPPEKRRGLFKGWTMPWQEEHWQNQPAWSRIAGQVGLGAGLTAGGLALGLAAPAGLAWLSQYAPWLTGPALGAMAHPTATAAVPTIAGLAGSQAMGTAPPINVPGMEAALPGGGVAPPTPPTPVAPPTLPQPGEVTTTGEPTGPGEPPQIVEVEGQRFWWNSQGGMYGTGGWELLRAPQVPGLTPEQEIAQAEAERAHQMETLQLQYQLEQQLMKAQAGQGREAQQAGAAQQMAQMYAADPYKYWAQLGMGTPEAVSRLTGGEVKPGQQFQQGVQLSTPSAQWWGGLLPSEQQQIMGGLNWMGVDPQDWAAMYQQMIPGLGQRQMGPVWAR